MAKRFMYYQTDKYFIRDQPMPDHSECILHMILTTGLFLYSRFKGGLSEKTTKKLSRFVGTTVFLCLKLWEYGEGSVNTYLPYS